MEHRPRYEGLVKFLLPYQDIWRNEIMLQYPRSLEAYAAAWVDELTRKLSAETTFQLLQGKGWEHLQPSLAAFHQELRELSTFPEAKPCSPLPTNPLTWVKIIPKKQHELERLAPFLADLAVERGLNKIVDIGGGQGHLAQTLAHHYGLKVLSLDMDPELQRIGERWQLHKWENSPHTVAFQQHEVSRQDETFCALMDTQTLTTGLHTCGALGVAHLEAAVMAKASVANLPCCYHKLLESDANLSVIAHQHPLPWNNFAFTLAAGAHRKVTLKDVEFRNRVKLHRYTLHFLLQDEFGRGEQVTLGNCDEKLYEGPFAVYAREQLSRLSLQTAWSDEMLESYFRDEKKQRLIRQMLAAATVRDVLGRPLEAALLSDRALWMQESGYRVTVQEIFDPTVSPRNLMLVASPS